MRRAPPIVPDQREAVDNVDNDQDPRQQPWQLAMLNHGDQEEKIGNSHTIYETINNMT
jgi:hypothetical protein